MDKKYWDEFYSNNALNDEIIECSTFSLFCNNRIFNKKMKIIELGCGNGRDANYFADNKHFVYAIDQSIDDKVLEKFEKENLKFIKNDFVYSNFEVCNNIDVFYSRFTIHSISMEDEDILLPKVYNKLKCGGLFCIEVRTTKDDKFRKGRKVAENTYLNDGHTRRFIESQNFLKKVLGIGFKIRYFNEQDDLSIYENDNPVLMRIILEK